MGLAELQDWLLNNNGFRARFDQVAIDSVLHQFPSIIPEATKAETQHDWRYLLLCGSLLAKSEKEQCQDAALRISHHCLQDTNSTKNEKDACASILDSLANRPAIELALSRGYLQQNFANRLPFPLIQDQIRRSIEFSVVLGNEETVKVNRFQRRFWNSVSENNWVSISAPTSAGKSFIILRWLAEFIRMNPNSTCIYLVPTRALIHQVEFDIRKRLKEENIQNVSISSLPLKGIIESPEAHVFVFTQERFQVLLSELHEEVDIDLLIIDEAQKVGDSYRGVLLQQVIETVTSGNENAKVLFASPLTENPEVLLDDASEGINTTNLVSEDTMVNQNLMWVSHKRGQPRKWNVELFLKNSKLDIGHFDLKNSPNPASKRLPFIAHALGNVEGGNLIYINTPSEAEKASKQLYDLTGDIELGTDEEVINNLVKLVQKVIHRDYLLATVLKRRIAFHYGNIPLLIRVEIENLFKTNVLKYLICTSTLMEGVNTPCRNIFVRGPEKGRGNHLTPGDFWNLAGRAGRWGQEFQGNIICIDPYDENLWGGMAPMSRTRHKIVRTADTVLNEEEKILKFFDDGTPRDIARKNPDLEYVAAYLIAGFLRFESINATPWAKRHNSELIHQLDEKIGTICNNLKISSEVILKNPGISPLAMDKLLVYFQEHPGEPRDLLPVPAESDNALEVFNKIFSRINKYLGKAFGESSGRVFMLALLVTNWMRGKPLAFLISSRITYLKKKNSNFNTASVIRATMNDVEQIAQFEAPKFIACYIDVLGIYLNEIGQSELLEPVSDLNIKLEFGVSQTTQLSLMGLGLSRTSTLEISEIIANENLSEAECLEWLRINDWATADMPTLVKQEIDRLFNNLT